MDWGWCSVHNDRRGFQDEGCNLLRGKPKGSLQEMRGDGERLEGVGGGCGAIARWRILGRSRKKRQRSTQTFRPRTWQSKVPCRRRQNDIPFSSIRNRNEAWVEVLLRRKWGLESHAWRVKKTTADLNNWKVARGKQVDDEMRGPELRWGRWWEGDDGVEEWVG